MTSLKVSNLKCCPSCACAWVGIKISARVKVSKVLREAISYAFTYTLVSILSEMALLGLGQRNPGDNEEIALVLFSVVPITAALIAGFRSVRKIVISSIVVVGLTLLLSVSFGEESGLIPPIIIRFSAGLMAVFLTLSVISKTTSCG